jgi:F0F1-type ATP synthase membrane subunit c/vacuolar-type H+-ATPase subunit K
MKTPQQLVRTNPKNDAAVVALGAHISAGLTARYTAAHQPVANATQQTADARQPHRVRKSGARS